MANKVKIFGIEIQFGKSEEDLTKVSQLLTTVINKTTSLKKMWTEYMTTISSSKELSQVIALLKQLETVSASATKAKKTLTAEERVANAEMREARKEEDLKIKSEKSHQGSINQLKADIALLNITWNKMSKEQRESTAEGKLMTTQLKSMRSELRNAKLDAGDFTSNIGNYMSGLYNKTTAMVTGIVAGLYTIKRGITALYSDYQDLEYRMSMVQAISGATADEFERLTLNAKLLGGTTEYTATEVAGLQLAYSRMGFVPDQILEMTSATLDLATATGEDLAQSADIAGTVIRGFNLDAEESGRVVDVMAKSFNSSSLQLDSFYEAMKYVAPVATAANVTLEETTAMLGVLADRGIRGSQAGTALRTIFLQMAADGGSVTDRLAELSDQGLELGDALDEVGKRAVTSLMVLAGSKSSVDTLTLGLNDAEGAAKSAADTIRDTLQGDVDNFTSALEARMISIGTYLAPLGRNVVQFGTTVVRELGSISKAIATGTSAWLAYNVAMKWSAYWSKIVAANKGAATLATTIETAMVSKNTTEIIINSAATSKASTLTKALAIAKLLLAGNTAAATVAMKALSVSIASTGVGLLVVGLASAISYFAFFRKGADDATSAQDKFNKSQDEFNKKLDERRSRINDLIAIVKDETKTDTQQYLAFEELKKIIPELTDKYDQLSLAKAGASDISSLLNLRDEADTLNELQNSVAKCEDVIKSTLRTIEVYEDNGANTGILERRLKQQREELSLATKALKDYEDAKAYANLSVEAKIELHEDKTENLETQLSEMQSEYDQRIEEWKAQHPYTTEVPMVVQFALGLGEIDNIEKQIKEEQAKIEKLKTSATSTNEADTPKESDWSLSKDIAYNTKLLELKQQLFDGEIASEAQYQEAALQLEIDTLKKRLALNLDDAESRLQIRTDLVDKETKQRTAQLKAEETYIANRKKQEKALADYIEENIDAELDALEDGVDKKVKINDQATAVLKRKAEEDYQKTVDSLNAEQKLYEEGSEKWQALEDEKLLLASQYSAKLTYIVKAGEANRVKIYEDASKEEIEAYLKIADNVEEIEEIITRKKSAEAAKRKEAMAKEYNEAIADARAYYNAIAKSIASDPTISESEKKAQSLENEIKLYENLAKAEEKRIQALQASGAYDTVEYQEAISSLKELQKALENLSQGFNADGSGGSFLQQLLGLGDDQIKELKSKALDLASSISDAIFDYQQDASDRQYDAEIEALEDQYDEEVALLDAKLENNLISEEQYDAAIEALDEELAAREEEADKEAFEREKKLSLQQCLIDTALAITKAFAQYGWPAGLIPAAFVAAEGAVQYASIAATKYAQGGVIPIGDDMGVVKGRSHAEGGHQLYIDGQPIGEIEGDELIAIVNKKDTARIGALSAANSVNGRKFASGGVISPYSYYTSSVGTPATFTSNSTTEEFLVWIKEAITELKSSNEATNSRIDNIKVAVVAQDVTDMQDEIKKVKAKSSW